MVRYVSVLEMDEQYRMVLGRNCTVTNHIGNGHVPPVMHPSNWDRLQMDI